MAEGEGDDGHDVHEPQDVRDKVKFEVSWDGACGQHRGSDSCDSAVDLKASRPVVNNELGVDVVLLVMWLYSLGP